MPCAPYTGRLKWKKGNELATDNEKYTKSLPSLDVVLSESKTALNNQLEQISSLDTKLGVILGLSGVILVALLAFTSIYYSDVVTKGLFISAVAFILASLLSTAWGYRIRKYKAPPDPSALREFYLMEEPQETKIAIVDYLCSAYDWNQQLLASKVWCLNISFTRVFLSAIIMGVIVLRALVN